MKKACLLITALTFLPTLFSQVFLMINEVSQGDSLAREFVEFVVVGTPTCTSPVPGIDVRGTIIDDNNGFFTASLGGGLGVAPGAIKFADTTFWANIPQGTYIVLYNAISGLERNLNLPADDFSTTDGNCRLVIPISPSNRLFLGQIQSPNSSPDLSYPIPTDPIWSFAEAKWTTIGMRNQGDSFQIQNNPLSSAPFHSVSWGNVDQNVSIYFTVAATQTVFSFINSISNDFRDQNNWISGSADIIASNLETPGLPNSPENDAWVASMNPGCRVNPSITFTTIGDGCGLATGTATANLTGFNTNLSYLWENGQTTQTATNLAIGTYTVVITDNLTSCTYTDSTIITTASPFVVSTTPSDETCTATCDGSLLFTVTGGIGTVNATYTLGNNSPQSITGTSVSGLCGGSYMLTVIDGSGCAQDIPFSIGSTQILDFSISNDATICIGESISLSVQGTSVSNIIWSTGETSNNISVSPPASSIISVTFTQSGCTISSQSIDIEVIPCILPIEQQLILPNIITPNNDNLNDYFVPVFMSEGIDVTSFVIVNRWGNVMYESDLDTIVWNGKTKKGDAANDGTYFYILNYTLVGQKPVTLHGSFQLVRGK